MKTRYLLNNILLFALLALSCAGIVSAQISQLTASVDKNTALTDESIRLSVVANGDADRDAIDFSVLDKDFSVSRPSYSQSTQIINGSVSRRVTWTIDLFPRSAGTFDIPSFEVDGKRSQPFSIKVLPVDAANNQQVREFYVEAKVNSNTLYLQQQIMYTIYIHLAKDILRGQITTPQLQGAVIEQLGEDKETQKIIDGVRYRIIERKFSLIPQSSGKFTITGPVFEAEISTNSRRSFANFGRSKTISRRAPEIEIEVLPIPDDYSYPWLPSELVELTETWQGDENQFTVGQPITRTVTINALGVTKEQLPSLDLPYHPSFKTYPEKPKLSTLEHRDNLVAQGVFNSAIIPEKAGEYVLPEVRIPWFNVNTKQTEFATIAARSVTVLPSTEQNTKVSNDLAPVNQVSDEQTQTFNANEVNADAKSNNLLYVLVATNALTLLALLFLLIKRRNNNAEVDTVNNKLSTESLPEPLAFDALCRAIEKGQKQAISPLLDSWLRSLHGNSHFSVSASLSMYSDCDAQAKYNDLLQSQYANTSAVVDFSGLLLALKQYRKLSLAANQPKLLATMYPR